jgi:hypothetical protein
MELALWLLVIVLIGGVFLVLEVIKHLRADLLESVHRTESLITAKVLPELTGVGLQADSVGSDVHVLRRIVEEKTGLTKDEIYALDKRAMDEKFKRMEEVIKARDTEKSSVSGTIQ